MQGLLQFCADNTKAEDAPAESGAIAMDSENDNLADISSCDEDDYFREQAVPNDPELARVNQDKALLSLGLYRFRIPTDGNCLFRAVASQLKLDQERYHPVLRKAAVKWMQANAEELIVGGMLDCVDEIDAASELGTWAGQAAIVALANIFSINIAVVQGGDKGDIDIQHISPFETSVDGEEQGSVILAYTYNGHFDAVVDQEDLPNRDYEAWQYEQVHGTKPTDSMGGEASEVKPKQALGQEVFVPSVKQHEPEIIQLSCAEGDSISTANFAKAEINKVVNASTGAESETNLVEENLDASVCSEQDASADCLFLGDDTNTQIDRTWRGIRLDGAARPTKELSQEELDSQQQETLEGSASDGSNDAQKDSETLRNAPEGAESQNEQDDEGAPVVLAGKALGEDDLEGSDDRWSSFFKNVSQELENENTRAPPPPLNMKLDDIPEETQSQLTTPMSTPLATPHEMENPWANFTQTIERDSSFSDNNSSDTLTDDENNGSEGSVVSLDLEKDMDRSESTMSDNVTFIEKNVGAGHGDGKIKEGDKKADAAVIPNGEVNDAENKKELEKLACEVSQIVDAKDEPMEIYNQDSLESDFSLASQTSSMSIAMATDDTESVSADPRPTLNMQLSQDSLADVSPWSSFSQSLDKEAQLQESGASAVDCNSASATNAAHEDPVLRKIPGRGAGLNIVPLGDNASFNTSEVPDKSVANVAPTPQKFKTIRDLPKQWEDVKKDRSSLERETVALKNGEISAKECGQGQNKTEIKTSNAKSKGSESNKLQVEVEKKAESPENKTEKSEADKKFVSSTEWENNAKSESCKNAGSQAEHIASINISNIMAPEDCVKCEHIVKPRIRVIPVQFCGKRGATLKNMKSSNTESGLSITGVGEVKIPIQSKKQRIKAEIIEERGSVDINGHQTETVERKGTYTTLPDEEPSEPKIDLIEHRPPVLTALSGSKITITDNPNVPSPSPVIKPKKRVPVRVVYENSSAGEARSFESQVSQSRVEAGLPRVRSIPVQVTDQEVRSRARSHESPPTPSGHPFAEATSAGSVRPSFQQSRGASCDSRSRKASSSSTTSTGYQSQTSLSSSFDTHDSSQDYPDVFSRQRSVEAANVWDDAARDIGNEAEMVKQRIEAARSALGGHRGASGGASPGVRNVGRSYDTNAKESDNESERGYNVYGSGRSSYRDQAGGYHQREEAARRAAYRADSTDSSYSTRGAYSRPDSRSTRSDASWGSRPNSEDRHYPWHRTRDNRYREDPTYHNSGDRPSIRIGAEASRFRNEEIPDRRRNESLGGSIQIEVVHEQTDPFRDRLRRMTASDEPPSYFDMKEDPVTVRNLLRPLNLTFVNSLLNTEIDSFFGRDDFFSEF